MSNENKKGLFGFEIDHQSFSENTEITYSEGIFESDVKRYIASSELESFYQPYSGKQLRSAGRNLRKKQGNLKNAIKIVQSYRTDHKEPLGEVLDFIEAARGRA